ncbi:YHYH domain-containing protein [Thauera mechernichensis]|uniref:YHYH domain-containing protein n=1 Tax=Thauera mechernichensis TaxID=82788 RepID=A0ABW3WJ05_9RHOO|nr:YHYH domain-containing protein [Thauera mechernichensis]MDG3066066.1 YHYH domain-containing protein [Thauera mechernichensis]
MRGSLKVLLLLSVAMPGLGYGHGGGLDAKGCHMNRKTGDYPCHRAGYSPPPPAMNSAPVQRLAPSPAAQPQRFAGSGGASGARPAGTTETNALAQIVERQEATIMRLMSEIAELKAEAAACRSSRR